MLSDADASLPARAIEAVACNLRAAPLALSVSFFGTLAVGARSWGTVGVAANAAGNALVSLAGDAKSPWTGAELAWPVMNAARTRARRDGDDAGARRAAYGALVVAAVAAEAPCGADASCGKLEDAIPELVAETTRVGGVAVAMSARASFAAAAAAAAAGDGGVDGALARAGACARLLLAVPRWLAPTLARLASIATDADADADADGGVDRVEGVAGAVGALCAASPAERFSSSSESGRANAAAAREAADAASRAADALVRANAAGAANAAKAARVARIGVDAVVLAAEGTTG